MKRLMITAGVSLVVGLVLGLLAGRQLPPTKDQVVDYLSNLSVGEFSEFTKRLTTQWGFQSFPTHLVPADSSK